MSNVDTSQMEQKWNLDGNRLSDYTPSGNVIYASHRLLSDRRKDYRFFRVYGQDANLSEGEFGLILP